MTQSFSHLTDLGFKPNSTRIESNEDDLPGQKRECEWWLEGSAIRRAMKAEMKTADESGDASVGLFSTLNPDETQSLDDYINSAKSDPFPFDLNPGFDLQCIITVSPVLCCNKVT